jgi:hypothetical protein
MSTDAAVSDPAKAQRRRKLIHLIFWLPTAVCLPPLAVITLLYIQHVLSLAPMYFSGEISSRPDAQEALTSSANWSLIHVGIIGLWLLLGVLGYRWALRRNQS